MYTIKLKKTSVFTVSRRCIKRCTAKTDGLLFNDHVCMIKHYVSLSLPLNTNIHDNFKAFKRCKLQNLYSLESMVIEEENPILNIQITLYGKRIVLSIY